MWTRGDYFAHKNKRIVEQTSFEGEFAILENYEQ